MVYDKDSGCQMHMCYNEIGLCLNIDTPFDSIVNRLGRVYAIAYRERIYIFTSYKFCISTPILKLVTTIFVIHHY